MCIHVHAVFVCVCVCVCACVRVRACMRACVRACVCVCVYQGDVEVCQLLLKKGAQLSEVDSAGRTSLHWAILSLQVCRAEASVPCIVEFRVTMCTHHLPVTLCGVPVRGLL